MRTSRIAIFAAALLIPLYAFAFGGPWNSGGTGSSSGSGADDLQSVANRGATATNELTLGGGVNLALAVISNGYLKTTSIDTENAYLRSVPAGAQTLNWEDRQLLGDWDATVGINSPTGRFDRVEMSGDLDMGGCSITNLSTWHPIDAWLVSAPTVTVTDAGEYIGLTITNDLYLTMDSNDWPTNGVGWLSLDLHLGGYSLTWDTNVITGTSNITLETNAWDNVLLRRGYGVSVWEVRD